MFALNNGMSYFKVYLDTCHGVLLAVRYTTILDLHSPSLDTSKSPPTAFARSTNPAFAVYKSTPARAATSDGTALFAVCS